jgi:hypothetical protein
MVLKLQRVFIFVIQYNFQTDFYMKKHEIKHFVWHN